MSIPRGPFNLGRLLVAAVLLAVAICWSPTLFSQSPAPGGTASLTGRVVMIENGAQTPIRRARVILTAADGTARVTDADTDGRYRFDAFPPGQYRVTAAKPGFVRVGNERDASGQPPGLVGQMNAGVAAALLIPMERAAAIEGRLLNDSGEPAPNVLIRALRWSGDGSTAPPVLISQSTTDNLGRYRLHTLPPGLYSVGATLNVPRGTPPPGVPLRPEPPMTYYPGSARIEDAQRVGLSPGATVTGIEFTFTSPPPPGPPPPPPPNSVQLPSAPRPAGVAGTGTIAGRVTRADSGRPIAGAGLSLIRWEGGRGMPSSARTDAAGRFEFTQLVAGQYQLTVSAAGLLPRDFGWTPTAPAGRRIELADGSRFDQANVALPRPSAVEGRIVDEFGDPVAGLAVQAALPQFIAGARRLAPANGQASITDDLGRFRVFGLAPDDYYVMALSGAFATPGDLAGFAPTFYPGTRAGASATAIHVDVGKDAMGLDFALVPAPASTVSGVVVDETGKPLPQASLMLTQINQGDVRMIVLVQGRAGDDGSFLFRNVPEGSYAIQAFGRPTGGTPERPGPMNRAPFGSVAFDAAGPVTSGVRVEVRPGTTLKGRVLFDGDGPKPAFSEILLSAGPANFVSAPLIGSGPPETVWNDDGTFEVRNLNGMRVIGAQARPETWTIQRMTLDGRDVTSTPLDFGQGDVEGLEVTLTNRNPALSGSVMDGDKPAADYAVILFSADIAKWVFPSRFLFLGRPTQQGGFRIIGAPPGAYLAIALERVHPTGWQDPAFLETLRSRATAVTLVQGQDRSLNLRLVR